MMRMRLTAEKSHFTTQETFRAEILVQDNGGGMSAGIMRDVWLVNCDGFSHGAAGGAHVGEPT